MTSLESKQMLVKEIDKDFDLQFNAKALRYEITHRGGHFMHVPWGGFTKDVVDHIRKTVYINRNGNILDEIDEANFKVELEKKKAQDDLIEQTARDIGKPLYDLVKY